MQKIKQYSPGRGGRLFITGAAGIGALLAGSAVYASHPQASARISACYNSSTRVVTIPRSASCPTGTVAISWTRYTQLVAMRPLKVDSHTDGKGPTVSLNGVIPVSKGGTGSSIQNFVGLTGNQTIAGLKTFQAPINASITGNATGFAGLLKGDVTGTQSKTLVTALRGYPVSTAKPGRGDALVFDGKKWAAKGLQQPRAADTEQAFNTSRIAINRYYAKNLTGYDVTAGLRPSGVIYDGAHLWVADHGVRAGIGGVTRIDLFDGSRNYDYFPLAGCNPTALTYDGSRVWVLCGDPGPPGLYELSGDLSGAEQGTYLPSRKNPAACPPNTRSNTGSQDPGSKDSPPPPSGVLCKTFSSLPGAISPDAIAFDGSRLWIANEGSGNLEVVGDSAGPLGGAAAGGEDTGVGDILCGYDPDGTQPDDNQPTNIGDNGNFIGLPNNGTSVPPGAGPVSLFYDGEFMWVADENAGQVVRIRDFQTEPVAGQEGGPDGGPGNGPAFNCSPPRKPFNIPEPVGMAFDSQLSPAPDPHKGQVGNLWVISDSESILTEITNADMSSAKQEAPIPLPFKGSRPDAIIFDGNDLWISTLTGWVVKYNPFADPNGTGWIPPAVPLPSQRNGQPNPDAGLVFDGTNVWVALKYGVNSSGGATDGFVRLL